MNWCSPSLHQAAYSLSWSIVSPARPHRISRPALRPCPQSQRDCSRTRDSHGVSSFPSPVPLTVSSHQIPVARGTRCHGIHGCPNGSRQRVTKKGWVVERGASPTASAVPPSRPAERRIRSPWPDSTHSKQYVSSLVSNPGRLSLLWCRCDSDQQQFMMRPTRRERDCLAIEDAADFLEPQQIPIERQRPFPLSHRRPHD